MYDFRWETKASEQTHMEYLTRHVDDYCITHYDKKYISELDKKRKKSLHGKLETTCAFATNWWVRFRTKYFKGHQILFSDIIQVHFIDTSKVFFWWCNLFWIFSVLKAIHFYTFMFIKNLMKYIYLNSHTWFVTEKKFCSPFLNWYCSYYNIELSLKRKQLKPWT